MNPKTGSLILVATPIGNLADISLRAIETLRQADYIAAEDTRHSGKLLKTYEISTKMISLHKFNETEKRAQLLHLMQNGSTIALISDAGTPGICDPGEDLVRACIEQNIAVRSVPGANAALTALVVSGFATSPFSFYGFLPKKRAERLTLLKTIADISHTTLFYESPHRLLDTLSMIEETMPRRRICLCRELTKLHEEITRDTAANILASYENKPVKGEIVLVIEGACLVEQTLTLSEAKALVEEYIQTGMTKNEAIKEVCRRYQIHRQSLYRTLTSN
ncbi:MAG: 16S rRNA (cytidine(1402)-2'-O)-methyltransferase [Eubacteriaceae bacterium]|jgi:16S rRNA (cytidine1402-2'-O)-methyltransferase|nr:16S rRNA (cytidine(1402)-2'-O)-methyltransferase [Eubacteriaceae bacterium]